jgi:AcrR family transcriptional regulator
MAQSKTTTKAVKGQVKPKKSDSYHHGDLKSELLETALKMLKTKSPNELSLRELAREAGVSQAAPYRHFKSKEELMAAIMTQGFELKSKYMQEAVEKNKDDVLKMYYACALSYFKMGKNHPQHFKLMFGPEVIPDKEHQLLMHASCTSFALLKNMIVKCQDEKLIGGGDPYVRALHCWTVVHGFTMLYAEGRLKWLGVTDENAEQAFLSLLSQYLKGGESPLLKQGFEVFHTKESAPNLEHLEQLSKTVPV